jgi:Ran GTPase-activating protein (RanGAP) involved in mRNA processing and transport
MADRPCLLSSAGYTDLPNEIQKTIQKTLNKRLTIGIREYDAKVSGNAFGDADEEDEDGGGGEPIDISWEWHDVTGITCDATGSQFEDESMVDFMQDYLQGFQRCHNLQSLDLCEGEFYEEDDITMQVLYNSMKSWPRLVELRTPIIGGETGSDMSILGKILSENKQLERLTINNRVNACQLKEFEASLTTSHVKELKIGMITFDFEESKVFADILEKFPDLQMLDLSDRHIELEGLILLLRVLRNLKSLTHLDLEMNDFGEAGWKAIAFFLTLGDRWKSLKVIKLGHAPSQRAAQKVNDAVRLIGRGLVLK